MIGLFFMDSGKLEDPKDMDGFSKLGCHDCSSFQCENNVFVVAVSFFLKKRNHE